VRLGLAGGELLRLTCGDARLTLGIDQLVAAWSTPF